MSEAVEAPKKNNNSNQQNTINMMSWVDDLAKMFQQGGGEKDKADDDNDKDNSTTTTLSCSSTSTTPLVALAQQQPSTRAASTVEKIDYTSQDMLVLHYCHPVMAAELQILHNFQDALRRGDIDILPDMPSPESEAAAVVFGAAAEQQSHHQQQHKQTQQPDEEEINHNNNLNLANAFSKLWGNFGSNKEASASPVKKPSHHFLRHRAEHVATLSGPRSKKGQQLNTIQYDWMYLLNHSEEFAVMQSLHCSMEQDDDYNDDDDDGDNNDNNENNDANDVSNSNNEVDITNNKPRVTFDLPPISEKMRSTTTTIRKTSCSRGNASLLSIIPTPYVFQTLATNADTGIENSVNVIVQIKEQIPFSLQQSWAMEFVSNPSRTKLALQLELVPRMARMLAHLHHHVKSSIACHTKRCTTLPPLSSQDCQLRTRRSKSSSPTSLEASSASVTTDGMGKRLSRVRRLRQRFGTLVCNEITTTLAREYRQPDCFIHDEAHMFNCMITMMNNHNTKSGDTTFQTRLVLPEWNTARMGPRGKDLGMMCAWPIACLLYHSGCHTSSQQGNDATSLKDVQQGFLDFLELFWAAYSDACVQVTSSTTTSCDNNDKKTSSNKQQRRNSNGSHKKQQQVKGKAPSTKVFQSLQGWCGWFLYFKLYLSDDHGFLDHFVFHDDEQKHVLLESIGVLGLQLMKYGFVSSSSDNKKEQKLSVNAMHDRFLRTIQREANRSSMYDVNGFHHDFSESSTSTFFEHSNDNDNDLSESNTSAYYENPTEVVFSSSCSLSSSSDNSYTSPIEEARRNCNNNLKDGLSPPSSASATKSPRTRRKSNR